MSRIRRLASGGPGARRKIVSARVRKALENGVHSVVFQPIVELESGTPVGVEALSRFEGPPDQGPQEWFADAGGIGLRYELELAAVRKALAHLPRIPDKLFLSVNVSPETLCSHRLHWLLSGSEPARVVVEITEHAPMEDYDAVDRSLAALRELGVRLAIDDAGAGFASLRHVLSLDPEVIKLDRTLTSRIESDPSRQALAAGLISFADAIGATIVVEGVERAAEAETLRKLGVGYGQGFYFARPMPLAAFARAS